LLTSCYTGIMDSVFPVVRVTSEMDDESEAWNAELQRLAKARASLRSPTAWMAAELGLGPDVKLAPLFERAPKKHVNKCCGGCNCYEDGSACDIAVPLMTPKNSGRSRQAALDLAVERECLGGVVVGDDQRGQPLLCRSAEGTDMSQEKPEWVSKLAELVRAVATVKKGLQHISSPLLGLCPARASPQTVP
ncbi:hypothetical protein GOODEAATRI_029271, partial [Goodea atripinnis]